MASYNNNFIKLAVPCFDGHYDHWSMVMENFLRSKEYWLLIKPAIEEPKVGTTLTKAQKIELEVKCLKHLKVKNYIF